MTCPYLLSIDPDLNPDFSWDLDGDFNASAGGLNLSDASVANSEVLWQWVHGRQVAYFDGVGSRAQEATGAAGLVIVGDMTQVAIVRLSYYATGAHYIANHAASGELEAQNQIYGMRHGPGTARPEVIGQAWEYGAGLNDEVETLDGPTPDQWAVLTQVRDTTAKTIAFYVNEDLVATKSYTNNPTGGGAGNLTLGAFRPGGADYFYGWLGGYGIWTSKLDADAIGTQACYALGGLA